jgi:tetratricopeptide (TPR) repeat protein
MMVFMRSAGLVIAGSFLLFGAVPSAFGQTAQPASASQPDHMLQGTMHYRLGNYEEALDDLTKARIKDPKSPIAAYYLGATLKKMQQYDKALPQLLEAVTLYPVVKEAYLELADVYYVLGRNDEALKAIASAEGDDVDPPQAAFLKGLVLVKKRSYTEAEVAFEKARRLDPRLASAVDFQIASIYHRQGKQIDALDRFTAVAAQDPNSDIGLMAKQQADVLSKRLKTGERFTAVVAAQYQYDSNVVLKPSSASSAVAITNESDTAVVIAARAEYAPLFPAPYSLKLQYALYLSRYDKLSNYDVTSNTFGIAPGMTVGGGQLTAPVSYNMTDVDGKSYLKAFGIAPVYVFTPVEGQQAQVLLRFQQKDYQTVVTAPDEDRDSTDLGAGLSWYWPFAQQKGFVNARYEINQENAKGRNWSYLGNKINGGVLYPASEALKLSLGAEVYLQSYNNVNSSFNQKRQDTVVTVTAQALYALGKNVDAHLMYVYMKDDSTIDVYAFSKNVFGIGVYARF